MTSNTTLQAASKVTSDENKAKLNITAKAINLVNEAAKLGGHLEILPDHVRAMNIIHDALDSIAGTPIRQLAPIRAAGPESAARAADAGIAAVSHAIAAE